jgi:hypothetical protein
MLLNGLLQGVQTRSRVLYWPPGTGLDGGPYKGLPAVHQWKKDGAVERATTRSIGRDKVPS